MGLNNVINSKNTTFRKLSFLRSSTWYFFAIALTFLSILFALVVDKSSNIYFIRVFLGLIYVIFLPGYSLSRAFMDYSKLDELEIASLSIGLSVVIITFTGILLDNTSIGITFNSVIITLFLVVIFFSTYSIIENYHADKKSR